MIVLDASAALDWLLRRAAAPAVEAVITEPAQSIHLPHLWAVEIAQVLRRLTNSGTISPARARQALDAAADLAAARYEHEPLLPRVWELRANLTAYDAVYVALAEALDATLVTSDARIAGAPGLRATVQVLDG
ncbi:PIN domain-containing protein [soil metagenome]